MKRVLKALCAGPLSTDELVLALQMTYSDALRVVREAVLEEAIDLNDRAQYYLTPRGQNIFAGKETPPLEDVTFTLPETRTQRIWSAVRQFEKFSRLEIAETACLPDELFTDFNPAADGYIRMLERSEFLWRLDFPLILKGSGGGRARFRLVRNSGPLAPSVRRNAIVFDPNTGKSYVAKP